jgi:hypothetical protein
MCSRGELKSANRLAGLLVEQMVQIAAFLMWSEKSDGDLAAVTGPALQAFADFDQGKVIA